MRKRLYKKNSKKIVLKGKKIVKKECIKEENERLIEKHRLLRNV